MHLHGSTVKSVKSMAKKTVLGREKNAAAQPDKIKAKSCIRAAKNFKMSENRSTVISALWF